MLARLADEAGEGDRAAAWRAYGAQKVAFFNEQIDPVARFVRSIDPRIVGSRTGDVFELVRAKIEEHPDEPRWIQTVWGVGYRFDP